MRKLPCFSPRPKMMCPADVPFKPTLEISSHWAHQFLVLSSTELSHFMVGTTKTCCSVDRLSGLQRSERG